MFSLFFTKKLQASCMHLNGRWDASGSQCLFQLFWVLQVRFLFAHAFLDTHGERAGGARSSKKLFSRTKLFQILVQIIVFLFLKISYVKY